jgi:hypothetical protein
MTAKWRLQLFAGAIALASIAAPASAQKHPMQLQYPVSVAVTYLGPFFLAARRQRTDSRALVPRA